jgi:gamma-glutamyltranspeptidase / glutathione hydrolase
MYDAWFHTFTKDGDPPSAGNVWRSEAHARTLEAIADSKSRDFYEGALADKYMTL